MASTREQFIAVARRLFADRGFYGTSIAAIAKELGLTKQALLHHFGSKEKLYGEVLRDTSEQLLAATEAIAGSDRPPAEQLEELVVLQYRSQMDDQDSARLFMRELLDNEQRAEKAGSWFLQPYLDRLVEVAQQAEGAGTLDRARALALVYQLLGAAHYFAVSQPTLRSMFGDEVFAEARACYEAELRALILARLAALRRGRAVA